MEKRENSNPGTADPYNAGRVQPTSDSDAPADRCAAGCAALRVSGRESSQPGNAGSTPRKRGDRTRCSPGPASPVVEPAQAGRDRLFLLRHFRGSKDGEWRDFPAEPVHGGTSNAPARYVGRSNFGRDRKKRPGEDQRSGSVLWRIHSRSHTDGSAITRSGPSARPAGQDPGAGASRGTVTR